MKKTISAIIIIGVLIFYCACSKKNNSTATGTFYFHLHNNIDSAEVDDTATLYRDANGRHFSLSTAQLYISNVRLSNANGTTYTIANAVVLTHIDSEQYLIGTAPAGTYTAVTFDVGLDAAADATALPAVPASSPLANTSMWFGSAGPGHIFVKAQGLVDTTAAQTGSGLIHFSYEIGSASNVHTVTLPIRGTGAYATYAPYILTAGSTQYIHLIADYGKLLSGINFKTQDSTDTYNINPSLATTIANGVTGMFHYEE